MTAPESLPCPCGAVVPVDRWGEHRRNDCTAVCFRFADAKWKDAALVAGPEPFTPRPGTRYA